MATLNGVIQYSGKLGQTVGMKGQNGKNYVRVRRDTIKNPKSAGQAIQRMIAATVAVAMGYLTEIFDNSVESKANGSATLNYLRSLWMNMLRTSDAGGASTYSYLPKGSKLFIANPYLISQGRLQAPEYTVDDTAGAEKMIPNAAVSGTITEVTASQAFPDVRVGDQITIICIGIDSNGEQTQVKYCRFAFKDDSTPCFVENAGNPGVYNLNSAAIDLNKAAGEWGSLEFAIRDGKLNIDLLQFTPSATMIATGLIISNVENKQRSTSYLKPTSEWQMEWHDSLKGEDVYPTYQGSSTTIDMASEIFLNNSALSNPAQGGGTAQSNLPDAVDDGVTLSVVIDGLPAEPTEVHITAKSGTETLTSGNIVGQEEGADILTFGEAGGFNKISITEGNDFGWIDDKFYLPLTSDSLAIVLSGYAIVNGQRWPF